MKVASAGVKLLDSQLALCSWHADIRTPRFRKRLARYIQTQLHLKERYAVEHRGVRCVLFTGDPCEGESGLHAPAVLAFRGTKLHRTSTLAADLQILFRAYKDLAICVTARKLVADLVSRLEDEEPHVHWDFYSTGHSLGGFLSIVTKIYFKDKVKECVAFEAPGLTRYYHDQAELAGETNEYWTSTIRVYQSMPNPVNMCNKHLGTLFRVNLHPHQKTDLAHIVACFLGTTLRTVNWLLASNLAYSSVRTCVAVTAGYWACVEPQISSGNGWFSSLTTSGCSYNIALAPIAAAGYWALQGTSAFLCCRLGITMKHLLSQHSMTNMVRAFNHVTGVPHDYVKMLTWPHMKTFRGLVAVTFTRALVESLIPVKTAEGIEKMFDRRRVWDARVQHLADYWELDWSSDCEVVSHNSDSESLLDCKLSSASDGELDSMLSAAHTVATC